MLDDLDQVDWHALSHAYGEADDVPELLSGTCLIRQRVYWDETANQGRPAGRHEE